MRAVSFFLFLCCCAFSLSAQEDPVLLVEEANTLAVQANEQLRNNQYEAAAHHFAEAANKYERAGRTAQARGASTKAGTTYETAGDAAVSQDQHLEAANLYAKGIEQFRKANTGREAGLINKRRQSLERLFTYQPTGTGQTTGHIAELSLINKSDAPVQLAAQVFYIPAHNGYQSYVARIPAGITLPAGGSTPVPIIGFCTDAHAPPVPLGVAMPPVDQWIPVQASALTITALSAPEAAPVLPTVAYPAFSPADVGFLGLAPGFSPSNSGKPILTYPNTSTPIGGTFAVRDHPLLIAPLLTAIVEQIEATTPQVQQRPGFSTPYHNDTLKEREAIIQHTVWIVMASLVGNPYTKDDFTKNIYRQFQQNTGTSVENLPPTQQEQLDQGINNFWSAFHATGTAAKVLIE